jgi:uncharacterized protein
MHGHSRGPIRLYLTQDEVDPFKVNVSALIHYRADVLTVSAEGCLQDVSMPFAGVPTTERVRISVDLELVGRSILVSGEAMASWEGECRRCLGRATGRITARLSDVYARNPGEDEYPLENQYVDLSLAARDALLVELPLAPICSEDCKGLCVNCGADLNVEACSCGAGPAAL